MKWLSTNRFLKGASLLLVLYGLLELLSAVLGLFTPSAPPPFSRKGPINRVCREFRRAPGRSAPPGAWEVQGSNCDGFVREMPANVTLL